MATTVGEFNQYTDGPDSFEPEDLPTKVDASEFRFDNSDGFGDADVTAMPRTAPDSSAVSGGDTIIVREKGRRPVESDGESFTEIDPTQAVAARVFSTSVIWVTPSGDYAAPVPVMLLSNDSSRMRVLVTHAGAADTAGVIIGSLTDIQGGQGFFLPARTQTELKVQGAVYATFPNWSADVQQPTPLTLWIERGL